MNRRPLAASLVALALGVSARSLSAQKKSASTTPWGEPDLQGTYTNQTLTPLERPVTLKDKALLTKEEAQALEKRSAAQREVSADAPPRPGDVGTYNSFWTEPGTKVVGSRRHRCFVDLPDGRVPLKREAEQRATM
jgi:hypothetical protein